jgi:hypothetical protein
MIFIFGLTKSKQKLTHCDLIRFTLNQLLWEFGGKVREEEKGGEIELKEFKRNPASPFSTSNLV